jgi:putative MFS transporter
MRDGDVPARFRWLPPFLRPPVGMAVRQEQIFLLVGAAALFAGYDANVFGLALPQIQASLHIPNNQVGPTISYFRLATIAALLICASADLIGRRRLLLYTILGQAIGTLLTAATQDYGQFVAAQILTRVFGYAEEMLCFVVIAEEMAAAARGWANGGLATFYYLGAVAAAVVFAGINLLPEGWRAIYVVGAMPLFFVAWLRRRMPETRRFDELALVSQARSKASVAWSLARDLAREHPFRFLTVLIAAAAYGFAISPATSLGPMFVQTAYHYSPAQATALFLPVTLISLALAILTGRLSDRIGRKPVSFAMVALSGTCFVFFYAGVPALWMPLLWLLGFFGFFCGDALIAGYALEIMPTRYRATVSGLRYLVEVSAGAVSLALEGRLYDRFGGHGPAIQWLMAAIPLTLLALLFLPEPAGRTLEEMAA